MIRIVVPGDVAERLRRSSGEIELVDEDGIRLGMVRRPPTEAEIQAARLRMGSHGPKVTIDDLIAKVESV